MEAIEAHNHIIDAVSLRKDLIAWGRMHFRSFPWRNTTDPYRILIAEVMLHRTQASQVVPIYEQFIRKYPDIAKLSSATVEELHNSLYSLGLRWRIDLIMDMVTQVNERFASQIPQGKSDLLSLPGVSDYVASAVRCFAWNLPDAIIDTNTVRVVGRVFSLEIKDSSRRNPLFRRLITSLVDSKEPRAYNFALLDLAAQICTKVQRPSCEACPVQKYCLYSSKIGLSTL
jgi:A/G-specific adenine glycosylase